MNGYFKEYTESHEGHEGEFYCEVKDGLILRHVSIFDGVYYWATQQACFDDEYDFTSRPEFAQSDGSATPVPTDEFEHIWNTAMNQEH